VAAPIAHVWEVILETHHYHVWWPYVAGIDDLSPGDAALRRAIALRYLADGLSVPVDDIIITNGALDALNLCLAAVTSPGDAVIVESPTFYAALQSLERSGLHAIEVATHPREGIDLQALEEAILQHHPRACWLMTTFQNPLGSLMPDEKKEALVKLLTRHDVALIEDDVYGELYFGDTRPRPAKAFDTEGIVMHCASFSKTLAPGYRVGWVAGGRYTRQIMRNKLTTSLATAAPTQAAIAAYLEKGGFDRHLRQFRQALALQQGELLQAIARYFPKGTRATRPAGGYFVWVELPAHIDTLKVHRAALDHGISIAPGPLFSSSGAFGNFLRLNHGHPWNDAMEQGMATLGKLLASG
jgi:DNA-binding transcriptional MocR family regulator